MGEVALIVLEYWSISEKHEHFSPIEFSAAFAAILAAGGFVVAKDATTAREDRLQSREQDREDQRQ